MHSPATRAVEVTLTAVTPASFANNSPLFAFNLFLMTAGVGIGVLMLGLQIKLLYRDRLYEHPLNPASLWRIMQALAGFGFAIRCLAEAVHMWAWSSKDVPTIVWVIQAKRWVDPVSIACVFLWFALAVLARPGIEMQLKRRPIPVDIWSRWPTLRKPATLTGLALGMAVAAVAFR